MNGSDSDTSEADRNGRRGSRPTIVVTVDGERLLSGGDSVVAGRMASGGPVSETMLSQLAASSDLVAMIVGFENTPLWMGRARRNSSAHQFLALAVRDRGCVLCSAPIGRCDTHHVIPWTAPAAGPTDLDNLALLCQRCHRDLHDRNHTLGYRWAGDRGGRRLWSTRPATRRETPAADRRQIKRE